MENHNVSVLCVVIAGILWGSIGVFSRLLHTAGFASLQVTEIRAMVTVVVIFMVILVIDRRLLKIELRDLWMFVGTGVVGMALYNSLYFETTELVSLSMSSVLLYTSPCFVVVISAVVFKERVTLQKLTALAIATVGCILTVGVIGSGEVPNIHGVLLGLGSGFLYALYAIFCKVALRKYHPSTVILYTFLLSFATLSPFTDPVDIISTGFLSFEVLLIMLGFGILGTAIPHFLFVKGLKGMEAGKASVIAFLEPLVATFAGLMLYEEAVTFAKVVGMLMVLVSIILLNIDFSKKRDARADP